MRHLWKMPFFKGVWKEVANIEWKTPDLVGHQGWRAAFVLASSSSLWGIQVHFGVYLISKVCKNATRTHFHLLCWENIHEHSIIAVKLTNIFQHH